MRDPWLDMIRKPFWGMAAGGVFALFFGLTGLYCVGIPDRITFLLVGLCFIAGGGGTLALSYDKVSEDERFAVRVIVRVGFMCIAPVAGLYNLMSNPPDLKEFLENIQIYAAVCAITVVPFGFSLLRLIWKEHKKHKTPRNENLEKEV